MKHQTVGGGLEPSGNILVQTNCLDITMARKTSLQGCGDTCRNGSFCTAHFLFGFGTGGDRQLREGTEEGGKGREGRRRGIEWEKNGSRNLAGASKGTIRHRNPRGTIFLAGSGSNVSVIGDGLYHIHRPTCFLPKDGLGEVF